MSGLGGPPGALAKCGFGAEIVIERWTPSFSFSFSLSLLGDEKNPTRLDDRSLDPEPDPVGDTARASGFIFRPATGELIDPPEDALVALVALVFDSRERAPPVALVAMDEMEVEDAGE